MNKKNLEDVKKLLVVVDMVNGFVREGAMASQNIEHIVPEIEELVKKFTEESDKQVVFVKDTHEENAREFKRYPVHCLKGTSESENIDELKKYENMALVHEKNSTSAIFPNGLLENIDKMKKLEEVVIVGCCTDICVINLAIPLQNYFDQVNRDIPIVVPENAVETYDGPNHKADEWNDMAYKFMDQAGIKLIKKYGGR
jgi:nicotinamidase-related amidase